MITFNLKAHNNNYYRGHEPSNRGNCWDDEEHALTFSIEHARQIASAWPGHIGIVISVKDTPITDEAFERELFCAAGGEWHIWPHRKHLNKQMMCSHDDVFLKNGDTVTCKDCEARHTGDSRWYDPKSGTMLDSSLKL